jgi:Tol biopolymer transport system component
LALSVGVRLGRFEILGSLGAGGMGEVYRAHDPQLERDVAIKVLPAEFSNDPARRRRFEQEARAAGGLNHPNILAVYDVGVEDGHSYIVTELLEGETLNDRLAGRALPPRKAADFAQQIAAGLAAAHDRGVIHRDIKPGNLFVTTDGRIKVLDFGLAKVAGVDLSSITDTITVDGLRRSPVVGSVTYMSPEQVRGSRIDHRTDIFSFGVVFYEMLAGFPPFRRASSGETLNAILYDDPPSLPPGDPALAVLERITRHCLEKTPDDRFQNFRDLMFDLTSRTDEPRSISRTRRVTPAVVGGAALLAVAAAGVGAFVATRVLAPPPPAIVHRVRPMTSLIGLEEFPAISPDGKMVAFTVLERRRRQIYVRFMADSPMRSITSDDADHEAPRWLPDSTGLVYFSPGGPGEIQGAIYRIPALGGAAQRLTASIGGGDVSPNGRLACFRLQSGHVQLVASTLEATDVTPIAELQTEHYEYPRWSPDGQWIAFQAGDGFRWDVWVIRAKGDAKPFQITHDSKVIKGLTWLPDSQGVIYASARASTFPYLPPMALWEARLNGQQQQLTSADASYDQPDLQRGALSVTRERMQYDIWKYPFTGTATAAEHAEQLTHQTGEVATPSASPDGTEVVYLSDTGGHANVWIASERGAARQITFESDPVVAIGLPAWSPDGSWIAYLSSKGNGALDFGVWLVKPDGSDNHQIIPKGLSPSWSDDGRSIYYVESSNTSIKRIKVAGGQPSVVRTDPARNVIGVHGSTVYYVVDRALMDGRQEFEIRAAPVGTGPSRVIKTFPAARVPSWQIVNPSLSPDGDWLAMPLTDGFTTNIWAIATGGGAMTQVTDFGERPIFITRRVSWSFDGRFILAAIGEGDADVVLLDGLVRTSADK